MTSAIAIVSTNPLSDYAPVRRLVLDAVSSPITRQMYGLALDEFFTWHQAAGSPGFSRATVQAHRASLESSGYSPSTINQRLSAIRKLASEAAANGLLDYAQAAAIKDVPNVKQHGVRTGNWLTKADAQKLLNAPDATTVRGMRDRAILGLLVGCGLRRSECANLKVGDIQQREGRWCIPDLIGKHGRIRTVPVPAGVKERVDQWMAAAGVESGFIFRAIDKHGHMAESLSDDAIMEVVVNYNADVRPHDLRRTCAKLCRKAGGEIEQIQFLLGHSSIQTTERYLGTQQDLESAPNDKLGLKFL